MAVWRIGLVGLSMDPRRGQSKTDERTVQLGSGDRSGSVRPYFLAVFTRKFSLTRCHYRSYISRVRVSSLLSVVVSDLDWQISHTPLYFLSFLAKGVDQRVISSETLHDNAKSPCPRHQDHQFSSQNVKIGWICRRWKSFMVEKHCEVSGNKWRWKMVGCGAFTRFSRWINRSINPKKGKKKKWRWMKDDGRREMLIISTYVFGCF